jgi:hypothetical protein
MSLPVDSSRPLVHDPPAGRVDGAGQRDVWADSGICPRATSGDCPLTATFSRWGAVWTTRWARAKRHLPALIRVIHHLG